MVNHKQDLVEDLNGVIFGLDGIWGGFDGWKLKSFVKLQRG